MTLLADKPKVTLFAVFLHDILNIYQDKKDEYKPLFDIASKADLSDPFNKVDFAIYNEMCDWLEKTWVNSTS